jgi:PAS domain S-box-containing protein
MKKNILHVCALMLMLVYLFAIVVVVVVAFAASRVEGEGRTVRVGVYQNEPKIFMDAKGNAAGFFIDLLEEIAVRERWTLVYAPCEWAACLNALEEGRIDLMPDVAYSEARDAKYDFHRIPVAESWSRVYARPGLQVKGFEDLGGRRVAVLKDSIQQAVFAQMMRGIGYEVVVVPVESLEEAFKLAANGSADAAIANSFFGDYFYQEYGLVKTAIVFQVTKLYYATAEGRNADLLAAIDRNLGAWVNEPKSVYYIALNRWTQKATGYRVPQSVWWAIGITGGLLFAAVGMVLLLRGQVRARTKHLERANQALRESEERYRLISTVASDYMFSTRVAADGKLVLNWVAGAFEAITGYTFAEYIAHGGWRAALHPDDLAVDDRDLEKIRANQPVTSEIRTITKRGQTIWVQVYAHPVLDDERKELVGIYGAVQDITKRKQAEAASLATQQQLFNIIEFLPDATFVIDQDKRVIAWNRACEIMTGVKKEALLGQGNYAYAEPFFGERRPILVDLLDLPSPEVEASYKYVKRAGDMIYAESFIARLRGGQGAHLWGAAAPLFDQEGRRCGAIEVIRDVTEQKRVEELEIARARAESADRLKSAFLATMSHELRTPLNSILGFTGILLMGLVGPLEKEQAKQLNMVQDSARHLLELINDVLDISKIEAGQFELAREPFDVPATIRKSVAKVRPLVEQKGLALTTAISAQVGEIVGDRRRVEQIIINLLSNAIKFTERGQVRVECDVQDDWLVTHVIDTGIGIRPEETEALFQPFRQLDAGITRQHEGTGLGLSICKRLVEMMGGKIWVESEWGQGSRFIFSLPLERTNV